MRISDCSSDLCSSARRRVDVRERHKICIDLVSSIRFRNRAHEPGLAGLGARVGSQMRFADATSIRYDGDDAPAAVLRHRGQHRFTAVHDTVEICRNERLPRSEEHTSELQSLMRISYAVFCLKKKK